jgi:hypothetical protein
MAIELTNGVTKGLLSPTHIRISFFDRDFVRSFNEEREPDRINMRQGLAIFALTLALQVR